MVNIELDAAAVHLAHANVIFRAETEAALIRLQDYCIENLMPIDRYGIRIEAIIFPQTKP